MAEPLIPFFEVHPIYIWKIPLQPFGMLVATGCLLGAWVVRKRAERAHLDPDHTQGVIGWVLVCGFIGAHLFDVATYTPRKLVADPLLVFRIWEGISSYGGFLGAAAGFFYYTWRYQLPRRPYADALAVGLAVGWIFGRTGCSVAHDHPGRLTDFFLAVRYPDGGRHDLGFYELLYAMPLCGLMFWVGRKERPPGFLIGLLATAYASVRFCLDFLRRTDGVASDPRYFGLTPAHYVSLATLATGIYLLASSPRAAVEAAASAATAATAVADGDTVAAPRASGDDGGEGDGGGEGGGGAKRKRR